MKIIHFLWAFLAIQTAYASSAVFTLSNPSELPDLVDKIMPGVVNISSTTIVKYRPQGFDDFFGFGLLQQSRPQTSRGSGFLIEDGGYVITNNHVIDQADEVLVTLHDKRNFRAKIIGKDAKMDIALLQIRDPETKGLPKNIQALSMGDSESVRIAEPVLAIGNPFGLQHTVTMGIISAKNRTIGVGPFDNFLQTDASINPGNSGGPLFNLKGEVIGINTLIFSNSGSSSGLGFAIPINEAKRILPDLKRYGRVPRPWLGLLGERLTPATRSYYRISAKEGVLIFNLVERGPADLAGMRQGDVIIQIEGKSLTDPNEIERFLASKKPGDMLSVDVNRGGKIRKLAIKLQELPAIEHLPKGIL